MATKTISIDLEAYRRLKGAKRGEESFSQTIKRVVRPPFDLRAWLVGIERNRMSREALDGVEEALEGRAIRSRRRR